LAFLHHFWLYLVTSGRIWTADPFFTSNKLDIITAQAIYTYQFLINCVSLSNITKCSCEFDFPTLPTPETLNPDSVPIASPMNRYLVRLWPSAHSIRRFRTHHQQLERKISVWFGLTTLTSGATELRLLGVCITTLSLMQGLTKTLCMHAKCMLGGVGGYTIPRCLLLVECGIFYFGRHGLCAMGGLEPCRLRYCVLAIYFPYPVWVTFDYNDFVHAFGTSLRTLTDVSSVLLLRDAFLTLRHLQ
jgi:hypothetical protein